MQFINSGWAKGCLLACICFITGTAMAQNGTLSGKIYEAGTGAVLSGAAVQLGEGLLGASSNSDGSYQIRNVPAGDYTLVVTFLGHQTIKEKIHISSGEHMQRSFRLVIRPVELNAVVVEREMLIGDPSRLNGIPGSAHYISAAELELHNDEDIHRALRSVPGVMIQEEDGYGLRPNIGFRGTGVERSEKITLMEDGILIAPAPYSAPAAYYFPTVGRMEGIEVRKGSSQVKYGPYTTGGALNLISSSIPDHLSGKMKLAAGQNGARTAHLTIGQSLDHLGFLAETYQSRATGFKHLDNGGETGFDKADYLLKFRLNTGVDASVFQEFSVKLSHTDELSDETYLGLTEADFLQTPYRRYAGSQVDNMDAQHGQIVARYFIRPSPFLDFTTSLYRNTFDRNWYKLDKVLGVPEGGKLAIGSVLDDPASHTAAYSVLTGNTSSENALDVKANNRAYLSRGVQSFAGARFQTGRTTHELELGLRYHEDEMDRFQWVDGYRMADGLMSLTAAGTPGTESNRIESAQAWATYLQYTVSAGKLSAIPGVRFENITQKRLDYGNADPQRRGTAISSRQNEVRVWIPGVGIDYRFDEHLSLFGGLHKGFAPPGSTEGAEPEESVNYELGSRFVTQGFNLNAVVFYNDYANLLGSDLNAVGGTGSGELHNGGEVLVKGFEFTSKYDFGPLFNTVASVPLNISYTFTDARFNNSFESDFSPWGAVVSGDELPYLPRHIFSASLSWIGERWATDISAKFVGDMRGQAGQGRVDQSGSIEAHTVIDASIEYDVVFDSRLFVAVRNLTDELYIASRRPAGIRPGLPRTLMLGIKTGF